MLIDPIRAKEVKVELFEADTIAGLEDALQAWLSGRVDEQLLGMEIESPAAARYLAYVFYTE